MNVNNLVNSAACVTVMLSSSVSNPLSPKQLTKEYIRMVESEISSQSSSCKVLSNFIYSNDFMSAYNRCKEVLPEQRYFSKDEKNAYQKSVNSIFKKTGKKLSW